MLASWCLAQVGDHDRAIEVIAAAREATTDGWERAAMRMRVAEELWWTGRCAEGLAELDAGADDPPGPWHDLLEANAACSRCSTATSTRLDGGASRSSDTTTCGCGTPPPSRSATSA
jgi:hypothetical protein